jgi:hypothetical protein
MREPHITRTTINKAKKSEDLTDLERLNSMSESEIEANALSDPDNQPLSLLTISLFPISTNQ